MNDQRLYPSRPFLGVSAVIRCNGRVLLVQRGREPLKGVWSFPGGLVESGETLKEAAYRELEEETGIKAQFYGYEDRREIIKKDDHGKTIHHYVLTVFLGEYVSGEASPGGDAAAVRWVGPDEAVSLKLTEGALELIERLTGD